MHPNEFPLGCSYLSMAGASSLPQESNTAHNSQSAEPVLNYVCVCENAMWQTGPEGLHFCLFLKRQNGLSLLDLSNGTAIFWNWIKSKPLNSFKKDSRIADSDIFCTCSSTALTKNKIIAFLLTIQFHGVRSWLPMIPRIFGILVNYVNGEICTSSRIHF